MRVIPDYTVRVLGDLASIAPLAHEWDGLWRRCPAATVFQRPEWLLAWMRSFHPQEPWFLEVRRGKQLVGIAPFLIYPDRPGRVLGLMGGGVSDYLDVLIDPRCVHSGLASIWSAIDAEEERWDVIRFTDLSVRSPLLLMPPSALHHEIQRHDSCSVMGLPSRLEDLKHVVPAHKLTNLRNARSRLRGAGSGGVITAGSGALEAALDDLFRLHHARWAGRSLPGVLADPAVQFLHHLAAAPLQKLGYLRFYTLRLNEKSIACLYTFFEPNQVLCYMQGFDPEFAYFSPGTQLIGAVMEDAVREGKRRINFLRGQEPYKHSWGAREEPTFCLEALRQVRTPHDFQIRVAA